MSKRRLSLPIIIIMSVSITVIILSSPDRSINDMVSAVLFDNDTVSLYKGNADDRAIIMNIDFNIKDQYNFVLDKRYSEDFIKLINDRFSQKAKVSKIEILSGTIILFYEDGPQVFWNKRDMVGLGFID